MIANQITGQTNIVVMIDQVDIPNLIAHCADKTGSPIQVAFRLATGGIRHIPKQGEKWSAKKLGHQWHLDQKLDSLSELTWVKANMSDGDTRLDAETLHVEAEGVLVNGQPLGTTTYAVFTADGMAKSFVLGTAPVDIETIQAFDNGLLIDPRSIRLSVRTVTFLDAPASGPLVIYYQRVGHVFRDDHVVTGHSVITGVEA